MRSSVVRFLRSLPLLIVLPVAIVIAAIALGITDLLWLLTGRRRLVRDTKPNTEAASLVIPNRDLDSGNATGAAEYSLADETYAQLLIQLSERKFDQTSPELRENILKFYSDLSIPIETKRNQSRWRGVLTALDQLKSVEPVSTAVSSPAQ